MWLERSGQWMQSDAQEPWVTKGWLVKTDQERADYLAAQQAAADAAAAQQALLDAMPAQFPTGVSVPVPDSNGAWMVLEPVANGEPVIALQASNSPLSPSDWKSIRDGKLTEYLAERTARRAAIDELGLTQAQVDAVRSYFDADVDALFPAMSVAQRNFMKVQRALTKAITKREIKEVR